MCKCPHLDFDLDIFISTILNDRIAENRSSWVDIKDLKVFKDVKILSKKITRK